MSGDRKGSLGCLALVSSPFLIVGLCFLYLAAREHIAALRVSSSWRTTEGEVLSAAIEPNPDSEEFGRWRIAVQYAYTIENKRYLSDRYNTSARFKHYFDGLRHPKTILDSYPVGRKVTVYYDPDDPELAVLSPEPPPLRATLLSLIYGGFFTLVGAGILLGPLIARRVEERRRKGLGSNEVLPDYRQPLHIPILFGVFGNLVVITGWAAFLVSGITHVVVLSGLAALQAGGIACAIWLGREVLLRKAFGRFRLRLPEGPVTSERDAPWEFYGPKRLLSRPEFELVFRDEVYTMKGENNFRWEGQDLKCLPISAVSTDEGWKGTIRPVALHLPSPDEAKRRLRWVIRVRDQTRMAEFPIPAGSDRPAGLQH